jgi:hypothetical protein
MRCDKLIQIRAPEMLARALDSAAYERLTSRSDYIRAALLDRLRADGIVLDFTEVAVSLALSARPRTNTAGRSC